MICTSPTHETLEAALRGDVGRSLIAAVYQYEKGEAIPSNWQYAAIPEVTCHRDGIRPARLDAILHLKINRGNDLIVGVEVKNALEDLLFSERFSDEIGFADYFFVGVPAHLAEAAIGVIRDRDPMEWPKTGLYNAETGQIILMPGRFSMAPEVRLHVLTQVLYRTLRKPVDYLAGGPYPLCANRYVGFDGMRVERSSLLLALKAYCHDYNLRRFKDHLGHLFPKQRKSERYQRLFATK